MLHPALPRKSRPLLAALLLLAAGTAHAADIHVVSSGGFAQAYRNLAPAYERASGDRLLSAWGPSMGSTSNAIPARLARGEQVDVVIMVGDALDKLMQEGRLVPGSKVVLAQSPIACAVRHGAARRSRTSAPSMACAAPSCKRKQWRIPTAPAATTSSGS